MSHLEIHTFGGFEVRRDGRLLTELESRKVEALGAYLIGRRGHTVSRDQLAAMLWPERPETSGRRNLRQALYNLRSTLEGEGEPRFAVDGRSVRFEPRPDDWLDIEQFERVLSTGEGTAVDARELASAVRLYRGEFLAGITVPGIDYEEWLLSEQERLRETAVRALRDLVDHALATGDHEVGIRYARWLVRVDPLSEEAHRHLIRLYALSGRRGRALAQYEDLVELLSRELDVAPLEETTELYRSVRDGESLGPAAVEEADPSGPVLPLVGRDDALARLEQRWREAIAGRGRLTLVQGAEGVGKTRLVKTLLHRVTSTAGATVLQGGWFELEPPIPYRGVREALDALLVHELDAVERLLDGADEATLRQLVRLAPPLVRAEGAPPAWSLDRSGPVEPAGPEELGKALARGLGHAARPAADGASARPVVLFLEDLHHADASSLRLLAALAGEIGELPLWVVATTRPGGEGVEALAAAPGVDGIHLDLLDDTSLRELTVHLVGDAEADELHPLLCAQTGGNALLAGTLVNLLWDIGALEPVTDRGWHLLDPVAEAASYPSSPVEELVEARVARLPPTARRILTLAAVVGPRFEPSLLAAVEGEEEAVVEAALHTLLDRWLVRLVLGYWADSRRDRDMTLWTGGARRGTFELSHGAVRRAVYLSLAPERRRALHLKVAGTLSDRDRAREEVAGLATGAGVEVPPEVLAHHFLLGGVPERAFPLLERAAARAAALGAEREAAYFRDRAAEAASSQDRATPSSP